jgi:predicted phosphoadenosine phosphosulfate sulfurtransferase
MQGARINRAVLAVCRRTNGAHYAARLMRPDAIFMRQVDKSPDSSWKKMNLD